MDAVFLNELVIKKARNAGIFNINYISAALNREAYSAEIYLEFQEALRVSNLADQLEDQGACQVNIMTFKHNDGNDSASNALVRVWTAAEKTGEEYTRGDPSKDLLEKAKIKFETEKKQKEEDLKNDAKLNEGIRQSLAEMKDKVVDVDEKMTGVGDRVVQIDQKVDTMEVKIANVQEGVCSIIPDYQKLLNEALHKLAHKTKEVDRIEYRMSLMTREINKRDEIIAGSSAEIENLNLQIKQFERENQELKKTIYRLDALESARWIIDTELEFTRDKKRNRT